MIAEEKIIEIRKRLRKGYPQGDLEQELLQEGYSTEDISAIFNARAIQNTKGKNDYPLAYVLGTGFGITGVAVLSVFNGSQLGYLFLLGGVASFIIGFFFEQEKKKNKG